MPKIDLTITISVVIAVCAIISPVLTTLINNAHQTKLKKLELKEARLKEQNYYKRDIYENFLKAAGRCISYADGDAKKDYGETYSIVRLYLPDCLIPELDNLNNAINRNEWQIAKESLNTFISKLHTTQQTM